MRLTNCGDTVPGLDWMVVQTECWTGRGQIHWTVVDFTDDTCCCVGFNGERLRALGICYQGFNFHLFIFSHVTNERPSVYQHRRCRNPSNSFPPLVFVFVFLLHNKSSFFCPVSHSQALSSVTFVRYLGETAYTLMCVSHPPTNATSLRTRPLLIPPARCTPAARISRRVDKVATNRDILPPRRRRLQFESIHDNARTLTHTRTHTQHTHAHTLLQPSCVRQQNAFHKHCVRKDARAGMGGAGCWVGPR